MQEMIRYAISEAEEKLRKACMENELDYEIKVDNYPMVFEIKDKNRDQVKMEVIKDKKNRNQIDICSRQPDRKNQRGPGHPR